MTLTAPLNLVAKDTSDDAETDALQAELLKTKNIKYFYRGNTVAVEPGAEVLDYLKPAVWQVCQSMTGFYLSFQADSFKMPSRIYGTNVATRTKRILKTFDITGDKLGVHMQGEKGSGKTMLAKNICNEGIKAGLPVLVVSTPFAGSDFNAFISSINTPCIVMIDEYDKLYSIEKQGAILSLLDGIYSSQKLFIITSNEEKRVSDYLKNRPGRMFYGFKFKSLEPDFVSDYVNDRLVNKANAAALIRYTRFYDSINFDMLQAIVEEMNRYGETVNEVMEYLNVNPETSYATYEYTVQTRKGTYPGGEINGFRPETQKFAFYSHSQCFEDLEECPLDKNGEKENNSVQNFISENDDYGRIMVGADDMKSFNPETGEYVYMTEVMGHPIKVSVKKKVYTKFNHESLKTDDSGWY